MAIVASNERDDDDDADAPPILLDGDAVGVEAPKGPTEFPMTVGEILVAAKVIFLSCDVGVDADV